MNGYMNSEGNVQQSDSRFEFIAGSLGLDFANTVGGLRDVCPQEFLLNYGSLLSWGCQSGLLTEGQVSILSLKADSSALEAESVFIRACELREAIYSLFTAITAGSQPASVDMDRLNRELDRGTIGAYVLATADGFQWQWKQDEEALDQVLGPIARSAATLLISNERSLVRQCGGANCGWLFIDTTKNHRRRWCSTTGCGNKARVRKHRLRSK